jgi:hypothetical protein
MERHEWLSALVSFAVLETKLKAEALRKQAGRRLMAAARRFMPAGYLSPTAAINVSFIYLQNQYFCGCRMVQSGYRLCGFHHILAVPSRLA